MRRSHLKSIAGAALALGLLASTQTAQAGSYGGTIYGQSDWSNLTRSDVQGTGVAPFTGVTGKGFLAACLADQTALRAGQPADAIAAFLGSSVNGVDGKGFKLAKAFKGSGTFAVHAYTPGDAIATPSQRLPRIPEFDTNLDFITAPSADGGCTSANSSDPRNPCYSHRVEAEESTPCVTGDSQGVGAAYVIVTLELNRSTHVPFDFTLDTPSGT